MLYACDQRFDVTGNLENFCELNNYRGDALDLTGCSRLPSSWLRASPAVLPKSDYLNIYLGSQLIFYYSYLPQTPAALPKIDYQNSFAE